jgi:outer membrane protein assembly factor BamA
MRSFLLVFLLAALSLDSHTPATGQTDRASMELGDLQVIGARRYSVEEIKKVSALEIGKPASIPHLDAAAERMAETGLFKKVSYRYVTESGRLSVTFEIEEAEWTVPVVFDNFVWFTDAQVVAAVRDVLPSFDGTAPPTSGIPERIIQALRQLLASNRLQGRVEFLPQAVLKKGVEGYLFRVADPGPTICALRFEGASAIAQSDLVAALKTSVGSQYSRTFLVNASKGTLVDAYRRHGLWGAAFDEPVTALDAGRDCSGVAVTLHVNEGEPYAYAGAVWTGNAALASHDLDVLLGIKAGEVAALTKLDDALRRIGRAYARHGYLVQRTTYTPRLDDSTRQVSFEMRVAEGPQFRLGTVDFVNLGPSDAAALRKVWRIGPGDVYDSSYPDQFTKEEVVPRIPRGAKLPRTETDLDIKKGIVNIRLVFGG